MGKNLSQYEEELNFIRLKWGDKILVLQQEAYVSDCGEFYMAHAIEDDPCKLEGDDYYVYWEVINDSENQDEQCDWTKYWARKI
jgi:hypothetical protein